MTHQILSYVLKSQEAIFFNKNFWMMKLQHLDYRFPSQFILWRSLAILACIVPTSLEKFLEFPFYSKCETFSN